MNNNIQVFNYQDFTVRTFTDENGEFWLFAKDVCDVLGLSNPTEALRALDDDEKMTLRDSEGHSGQRGGAQMLNIINEAGLYKLTFRSNKPGAKEFTRKVTHEILPQINHTGSYSINDSKPVVVEEKKKGNLPAHSGGIKAGERLAQKVFKCKKPEDFQAVLAMDEDFKDAFGYSWLDRHNIRLIKKFVPTTWEERAESGCWKWDKKEVFAWEHEYDLDKIVDRNNDDDDTVNFDEWSY